MLEEEAKKRWCPMTRVVFGFERGTTEPFNRFMCDKEDGEAQRVVKSIYESEATRCCGSKCMMWRNLTETETQVKKDMPSGDGWKEAGIGQLSKNPIWSRELVIGGYCGLAGKQ